MDSEPRPKSLLPSSNSQLTILRLKAFWMFIRPYVAIFWCFAELLFFSGINYGWHQLVLILKDMKLFVDVSSKSTQIISLPLTTLPNSTFTQSATLAIQTNTAAPTTASVFVSTKSAKDPIDPDRIYQNVFLVASAVLALTSLPMGLILDTFGVRVFKLTGCACITLGTVMLAFLGQQTSSSSLDYVLLYLGMSFIASGCTVPMLANYLITDFFPRFKFVLIGLYTGAFDSSSVVFLLVNRIYFKFGIEIRTQLLTLAFCGCLSLVLTTFLFFPPHKQKREKKNTEEKHSSLIKPKLQSKDRPMIRLIPPSEMSQSHSEISPTSTHVQMNIQMHDLKGEQAGETPSNNLSGQDSRSSSPTTQNAQTDKDLSSNLTNSNSNNHPLDALSKDSSRLILSSKSGQDQSRLLLASQESGANSSTKDEDPARSLLTSSERERGLIIDDPNLEAVVDSEEYRANGAAAGASEEKSISPIRYMRSIHFLLLCYWATCLMLRMFNFFAVAPSILPDWFCNPLANSTLNSTSSVSPFSSPATSPTIAPEATSPSLKLNCVPDEIKIGHISTVYSIILLCGCLTSPVCGFVIDRLRARAQASQAQLQSKWQATGNETLNAKQEDEEVEVNRRLAHVVERGVPFNYHSLAIASPPFFISNTLCLLLSLFIFFPFEYTLYACFVLFLLFRSFLFSTMNSYLMLCFPIALIGRLFGTLYFVAGIGQLAFTFVQDALFKWTHSPPAWSGFTTYAIVFLFVTLIGYVHPLHIPICRALAVLRIRRELRAGNGEPTS